ncbi:MAG TPA: diacylglycerol kinase family protein, partial [Kiloniellales bacterium]|nr:diacylglycerol kinase family protein [Kiloniellales bacterium]
MTEPRRLLVVFNPTAGARRRRRLDRFLRAVAAAGAEVTLCETTAAGDAHAFALAAREDDYDALVVAGGDGTINEAINGLLQRLPGAPALPLGVLPLGTANVLACELGLPLTPERAAAVILAGQRRLVSLGEANGRAFALMVGVGFDAAVVAGISPRLKRLLRQGAYV